MVITDVFNTASLCELYPLPPGKVRQSGGGLVVAYGEVLIVVRDTCDSTYTDDENEHAKVFFCTCRHVGHGKSLTGCGFPVVWCSG